MGLALSLTPHALAVWIRPLASGLCVVSDKILNPVSTQCFIARTVVRFPGASNSGRAQSQSCCAKPRAKVTVGPSRTLRRPPGQSGSSCVELAAKLRSRLGEKSGTLKVPAALKTDLPLSGRAPLTVTRGPASAPT
jgi:hypothetical protein